MINLDTCECRVPTEKKGNKFAIAQELPELSVTGDADCSLTIANQNSNVIEMWDSKFN